MDDHTPAGPDPAAEPESASMQPTKVFLGPVTRPTTTVSGYPTYRPTPQHEPPFWTSDLFKFLIFLMVAGSIGGWAYYNYFWLYRLPQERDLTDLQGKTMHVRMEGHDDTLLKYTVPGLETERYLSIAALSPSDQEFIAKLNSTPLARTPFSCILTDSTGKETAVRLIAHDDNWAKCALIADGSTHYVFLPSLAASDQAVIRLLPPGLNFNYPLDYTFTGVPNPGANVRFLGRNDDTIEYLGVADGTKHFVAISELAKIDQSFVRELPPYMADRPPEDQNSKLKLQTEAAAAKAENEAFVPNSSIKGNQLKALVVIEGDYSTGSGFITKMHDQYFVVTNQHVLSGNKKVTITTIDGVKLPTDGPLYGAIDYDVAILKIPDNLAENYLEIMDDPENNAKVDDPITIPGNSQGAGVPTQINGRLMAIGPELVEVNAQLVHGISGSPIIDRPAGKVVGIATMSITYKFDTDTSGMTTDIRWFGYRVDNIDPNKGWVKLNWSRFSDEGIKVRDAVDLYTSLDALLKGKSATGVSSQLVHAAIIEFQSQIHSALARNNQQDYQSDIQSFIRKLQSLADNGIADLSSDTLYPYHAKIVNELDDLRKDMDQAFLDNNQQITNLATAPR